MAWPDGGKRLCGEGDANRGAGGPGGVVLPDEKLRLCGGVKHHARGAEGSAEPSDVVLPSEELRLCEG